MANIPRHTTNNETNVAVSASDGRSDELAELRRLAHELRTPIGAVISRAEVLRNESYGPLGHDSYREYADEILASASHALNALMHTFDSLSHQYQRPHHASSPGSDPSPVNLLDTARLAIEITAALAADAGVNVAIDQRAQPCSTMARSAAVQRIALNLLTNAIKFTPVGGTVQVHVGERGDKAVLQIVDHGIGMGPAALQQINQAGSLHGLGYDVIHFLVRACGASIEVESERGRGTTVTVEFPSTRDLAE